MCWVEETPAGNEQSLSPQAEHAGIRTYFFSAENTEEQESWIQAMGEAARVQIPPTQRSAPAVPPVSPTPLVSWRRGRGAGDLLRGPSGEQSWGSVDPKAQGGTGRYQPHRCIAKGR